VDDMLPWLPLEPGDPARIGDHRTRGHLEADGDGSCLVAEAPGGGLVTIRLIWPHLLPTAVLRDAFLTEVAPLLALEDPGLVRLLETGVAGGRVFLVSEYAPDPSLEQTRWDQPLSGAPWHELLVATARALGAVHEAGLVHGALTPSGIVPGADGPRLAHAGISQALRRVSAEIRPRMITGAPVYVSPEELLDQQLTPAADVFVWAMCVTAGAGCPPFGQMTHLVEWIPKILQADPDLEALTPLMRTVLGACLAKDPTARPTIRQVRDELLGLEAPAFEVTPPPPWTFPPPTRWDAFRFRLQRLGRRP
jgi:serine/threonine protein kinase